MILAQADTGAAGLLLPPVDTWCLMFDWTTEITKYPISTWCWRQQWINNCELKSLIFSLDLRQPLFKHLHSPFKPWANQKWIKWIRSFHTVLKLGNIRSSKQMFSFFHIKVATVETRTFLQKFFEHFSLLTAGTGGLEGPAGGAVYGLQKSLKVNKTAEIKICS